MKTKTIAIPGFVVLAVIAVVGWAARSPVTPLRLPTQLASSLQDVESTAGRVDRLFERAWKDEELTPAEAADELLVLRRLSLALHGTIPSLEEIRTFDADKQPDRLQRWTDRMMDGSRFADYFAERLARGFVGVENGAFIIFRRGRFVEWLAEQLKGNTPYDQIVREMIAGTGLWTGTPSTNFVTAAIANDKLDENKLAGRSVRAFLGQRIDCAQCHDHPFDDWTQGDFAGLAAHFGNVELSALGVEDRSSKLFRLDGDWKERLDSCVMTEQLRQQFNNAVEGKQRLNKNDKIKVAENGKSWAIVTDRNEKQSQNDDENENDVDDTVIESEFEGRPRFVIRKENGEFNVYEYQREFKAQDRFDDPKTGEPRVREKVHGPTVPFHPEWLPQQGTRRERLAGWITHPKNQRFERAIANRVWGLMFGRPYIYPVDDLPSPSDNETDLLDILGRDFREHGYDLRRLIRVIAASRPFRLASTHDSEDPKEVTRLNDQWCVFPLLRLRPEQLIGAMLQASSITTIDQNSHLISRAIKYFNTDDFVREYGDLGESELDDRAGTIPQALLRMNGNLSNDMAKAGILSSPGRVARMGSTPSHCVESCFLVCLSRRPTTEERDYFLPHLRGKSGEPLATIVGDIFWTLYNSPEFSWNH